MSSVTGSVSLDFDVTRDAYVEHNRAAFELAPDAPDASAAVPAEA